MSTKIVFVHNRFQLGVSSWKFIIAGIVIAILSTICIIYCAPYVYLLTTSLKSAGQLSEPTSPFLPSDPQTFNYQGQDLPLYNVPIDGQNRVLALLKTGRTSATFIDPNQPQSDPITWNGRVRTLDKVFTPNWHFEN